MWLSLNKKKGGLLQELEQRIDASNHIKFEYEKQIKNYENWNSQLNYEYEISYQVFFEDTRLTPQKFQELDNYRQSIIDRIAINNNNLIVLKDKLKKQECIHLLLTKCYYIIDNCCIL